MGTLNLVQMYEQDEKPRRSVTFDFLIYGDSAHLLRINGKSALQAEAPSPLDVSDLYAFRELNYPTEMKSGTVVRIKAVRHREGAYLYEQSDECVGRVYPYNEDGGELYWGNLFPPSWDGETFDIVKVGVIATLVKEPPPPKPVPGKA